MCKKNNNTFNRLYFLNGDDTENEIGVRGRQAGGISGWPECFSLQTERKKNRNEELLCIKGEKLWYPL